MLEANGKNTSAVQHAHLRVSHRPASHISPQSNWSLCFTIYRHRFGPKGESRAYSLQGDLSSQLSFSRYNQVVIEVIPSLHVTIIITLSPPSFNTYQPPITQSLIILSNTTPNKHFPGTRFTSRKPSSSSHWL
jgi:hypothetical protein